jgi:hypothetical protein
MSRNSRQRNSSSKCGGNGISCCHVEESCWFRIESGPWGRHVASQRSIPVGTVLLQNTAVSHVWYNDFNDQRRCSYCGKTEGILLSCSACCRSVQYCGRSCQRYDYPQHRIECVYLRDVATGADPTIIVTNLPDSDEIRCLLRTFGSIQKCKAYCAPISDRNKHEINNLQTRTINCGFNHWMQMMPTMTDLSNFESPSLTNDRIHSIVQRYTTWTAMEVSRARQLLSKNNFGILDHSTLETIGQGVYPLASLWNHSCDPNCFVRFGVMNNKSTNSQENDDKNIKMERTILQMVAIRDIPPGVELTHSYVDLSHDTTTRQETLYRIHGFICDCRRCQGQITVKLPRIIVNKDYDSFYHWILMQYNPLIPNVTHPHKNHDHQLDDQDDPTTISLSLDDAISSYHGVDSTNLSSPSATGHEIESIIKDLLHPSQHIGQSLADEISSLRTILSFLILDSNQSPLSQQLYQIRGKLVSALLALDASSRWSPHSLDILDTLSPCEETKRYSEEICQHCQAMVAFLCIVMPPNHPLLGLQLFTLGDLTGNRDMYRWARHILRISHGPQHDLVCQLDQRLSTA